MWTCERRKKKSHEKCRLPIKKKCEKFHGDWKWNSRNIHSLMRRTHRKNTEKNNKSPIIWNGLGGFPHCKYMPIIWRVDWWKFAVDSYKNHSESQLIGNQLFFWLTSDPNAVANMNFVVQQTPIHLLIIMNMNLRRFSCTRWIRVRHILFVLYS